MGVGDADDGGSGGTTSDYKSFSEVRVEITDLVTYYEEMRMLSVEGLSAATTAMADMNMLVPGGLTMPEDGELLAEAIPMADTLKHRASDFQFFVRDVTDGVRNIGSAAAVIAEIYEGTDDKNAANVGDIGYVFSDPGAAGPARFGDRETWSEFEYKQAQQSGQTAMAVTDGPLAFPSYSPAVGLTYYHYADGSRKVVQSSTEPSSSAWSSEAHVVTTTIYGPNGQVISTTTERTYSVRGSADVTQTTVARGDAQNGSTSTTTTSETSDGTVTVTNQTDTTVAGQTTPGQPHTTEVHRGPSDDDGPEGPVEAASETLDTHGERHTVTEFGAGY
jgi:hypothetical protein